MLLEEDKLENYKNKEEWILAIEEEENRALKNAAEDPWRQKFHLMPPAGWLNDPNGLCFFKGEYHFFYQYSPFSAAGGGKYWGHYKSRDLLHFQRCPVMLFPEHDWDRGGVYSGSALVNDGKMYLYYTGNVKLEGDYDYILRGREHNTAVAVSADGMTVDHEMLLLKNEDYPSGLTCHVRDPKVFAYEGRYYMVLGARTLEDTGEVLVLESRDKYTWKYINSLKTKEPFGYMWECPDLFEVDGQWILMVSPQGLPREEYRCQNVYSSGYFPVYGDFRKDARLGDYRELDQGFDFYAPQTFLAEGRRILTGWLGMPDAEYENPTINNGWQHCLTIPRMLKYINNHLRMEPVKELEQMRGQKRHISVSGAGTAVCRTGEELLIENRSQRFYLEYDRTFALEWNAREGCLTLEYFPENYGRGRRKQKVSLLRNLRIILDATSVEIFVNDGEAVMSSRYYRNAERMLRFNGEFDMEMYELDLKNC